MAHGGTSFGFENGANLQPLFSVEPTSYDYDAPISEAGDLTPKYYAFRNLFSKYVNLPDNIPFPLPISPKANYGTVQLHYLSNIFHIRGTKLAPLWGTATSPKTFEELDQNTGFVLYETIISKRMPDPVILSLFGLRDRANIYINEILQGIVSRTNESTDGSVSIPLSLVQEGDILQILVENQGRIGFGPGIKEFKGLTGKVMIGKTEVIGKWKMYSMPLQCTNTIHDLHYLVKKKDNFSASASNNAGSFWVGTIVVPCTDDMVPRDTFLKLAKGWGKGVAWINNVNLGRYWPLLGPQETLYVPGPYLLCGENNLTLMELESVPSNSSIQLVNETQIDGPTPEFVTFLATS